MQGSSPESRLKRWLEVNHDLDFSEILKRIWDLLRGAVPENEEEEHLFCFAFFINRVRRTQNHYIIDLCAIRNLDPIQYLFERSGCLYARMKPQIEILSQRLQGRAPKDFFPYFYKVLENNLIFCNNAAIEDLSRGLSDLRWEWRGDKRMEDELNRNPVTTGNPEPRSLGEILNDLELRVQADHLLVDLKQDWEAKHLNALCHYHETLCGKLSLRLSRENRANIHQIHSRIRKKLRDYLDDKDINPEVARIFSYIYLKKLCQQTPISETYSIHEGGKNDPPA
ncbi:MAG: hypothetical protein WCY21_07320 [Candidatus Cloacimonadaceae bacterium]